MHRLTNTLLAILLATSALLCAPLATAQQSAHPWPTRGWPVSSPEEQGMSSERLARLVEFGFLNDMDSVLVMRHGRIVLEATYAPPFRAGLKHHVYSVTKSVVSTLVGMALGDGLLDSTDRRVVDFFADRTIANLDESKKAITVQQLLDMTSGLAWTEGLSATYESNIAMARSPDWQQFVLDQPMATAPGTRFYYGSGNSHLLSAILSKVTGRSANDYAREKLFGPLGIDDVLWELRPAGYHGRRLGPLPTAARHGEDRLSLAARRPVRGEGKPEPLPAAWIEGVRKADVDMRESWASDLRCGRQVSAMPLPRRLHRGRAARPAHRRDAQLDVVAVGAARSALSARADVVGTPRYGFEDAGELPRRRRDLRRSRRSQGRGDDRARREGESSRRRTADAAADASGLAGDGQAISGKTWRLAGVDPLRLRSLALKLDDPEPSSSTSSRRRTGMPSGTVRWTDRFQWPLAVGGRMPYGPSAPTAPGRPTGGSLMLEVQALGNDDVARVTHVFGDKTVELSIEWADGFKAKVPGRAED